MLIGFAVIILSVILSRNINGRAMTLLTPQQQMQFQETFRKRRVLNLVVMIVQIVGYFLALRYTNWPHSTLITVFISSILLWIGIQAHLATSAFQKLNLPKRVIQMYLLSSFIRIIGIVSYVALVIER